MAFFVCHNRLPLKNCGEDKRTLGESKFRATRGWSKLGFVLSKHSSAHQSPQGGFAGQKGFSWHSPEALRKAPWADRCCKPGHSLVACGGSIEPAPRRGLA